jgi:hypothetical protein
MRSAIILAALLLAGPARATEVRNADRPLIGAWDFAPRLLWSVDQVEGQPFQRPGELRVLPDGASVFRDFGPQVSHIFTPDGRHVCAFAPRGDQPGQVPHYLSCFVFGSEVAIGAPSDLHFFSPEGRFLESVPNNLFARFPVAVLGARVALFAPGDLRALPGGIARIVRVDLSTGKESLFDELKIAGSGGGGAGGPALVIHGLTPTIEAAYDRSTDRVYYGCSSE